MDLGELPIENLPSGRRLRLTGEAAQTLRIPFDIVGCSWPQPTEEVNGQGISEPEWDAPLMPIQPQLYWKTVHDEPCWTIDWRGFFKTGLKPYHHSISGEMRGFHVVFYLRVREGGKLVFWADDGCVVRRDGRVIHQGLNTHPPARGEIQVRAGDLLQVAQWQRSGEWLWAAQPARSELAVEPSPHELVGYYLPAVRERLKSPEGPPLKMYISGQTPLRASVALYSMILNGYAPSEVFVFGEHQWSNRARQLLSAALPFARFVPTEQLIESIEEAGGPGLGKLAREHWFVMKALIALLHPPQESCIVDDDVFILERLDEALAAFEHYDLVFQAGCSWEGAYLENWGWIDAELRSLPAATFNAGLYWIRNPPDPGRVAEYALSPKPSTRAPYLWEQGFIATLYARKNTYQLPTHRYLYPLWDGLPGGMLGYDYANNPCRFVSIHFGALLEKPSDPVTLKLAPAILGRKPEHQICLY